MTRLAIVLAWKYDGAPGIRTRKVDGKFEIFDWPAALEAEPTMSQIAAWTKEYEALPNTAPPTAEELARALIDASVLTQAQIDAAKTK